MELYARLQGLCLVKQALSCIWGRRMMKMVPQCGAAHEQTFTNVTCS